MSQIRIHLILFHTGTVNSPKSKQAGLKNGLLLGRTNMILKRELPLMVATIELRAVGFRTRFVHVDVAAFQAVAIKFCNRFLGSI